MKPEYNLSDGRTVVSEEELSGFLPGTILRDGCGLPMWLHEHYGWCAHNGSYDISPESVILDGAPLEVLYAPSETREEVLDRVALVAAKNALNDTQWTSHGANAANELGVFMEPSDYEYVASRIENAEVTL